ncbi:MAG TPA: hypothetical protein PLR41_01065 [Alphaproteobacteria bacterium]|nr:hypothetical protein [Alphaproteobacteria bacterium]
MVAAPENPSGNASRAQPGAAEKSAPGAGDGEAARLQELSRKLLDLWQDHLSALAQDPTLLAQALKLMSAAPPFSWLPGYPPQGFGAGFGMPGAAAEGGTGFAQPASPFPFGWPFAPGSTAPGTPFAAGAAAGAAPAAAASGAGAGDLGQLRARLAELEGRLAKLERGAGPQSAAAGGAGAKPGKPRRRPAKV